MGSVLAGAGWTVSSAILLQHGEIRLSAVDMIFYTSPWCIIFSLLFFVCKELSPLIAWTRESNSPDRLSGGLFMIIILCGGLLGFSYDLIHNQFVKLTSSMTMAIMGNTKLIVLIVISMLTLEKTRALADGLGLNIVGITIGMLGCIWYSWDKLQESRAQANAPGKEPLSKKGEASKLLVSEGEPRVGCGCFGCV